MRRRGEIEITGVMLHRVYRAWIAGVILAMCGACALGQMPLERFHQVHPAMGTEFTIDLYAADQGSADHLMDLAFDEVDRIEDLLSNYRPSSELSRIGREAGSAAVTTDPETFQFLEDSMQWSRRSGGAFDITVGPLLRAWGFFFHHGRVPSQAELAALRERVGWQHVVLGPATRSVRFVPHQPMELDPGSIGKGFAVDRVAALLRGEGVTSAFVSAGSSTLYGIGTPPGKAGWPVKIPDPLHRGGVLQTVLLRDRSLSTGACTEKFFIRDGHRYCHIFDPRTMRPVEGMLQTSVISPRATDSDALSTVVFVLNAEESRRVLQALPDAGALIFSTASSGPHCVAIQWAGDGCASFASQLIKEPRP